MQTALLVILVVVVLIFGFWLIQYSQFRNEEKKRQFELKRESQKSISPIRLRAYERLTLLELRAKEPEALLTWSIPQVQQYLLQTIRAEYDHNQSQQVYVSDEVWDMIINARDQMAAFVIAISAQLPKDATAQTYATALLTAYSSNGTTPTDKALEYLKNEAKEIM